MKQDVMDLNLLLVLNKKGKVMKKISILMFIASIFISIQANDKNVTINENSNMEKAKARAEALNYDNSIKVETKKDAYPGVEWNPKTSQPRVEQDLEQNLNTYPGVEWSPKK